MAKTGSTMNGSITCTSATTTAIGVYSMRTRPRPTASKNWLTKPAGPSTRLQPKARTTTDTSSGATKTFRSDIRVSQLQVPLLFMFDIPVGRENNIYLGGGPTLYWGTIEKTINETNKTTGVSLNDTDKIQGFAYGPTFIIGIQRRLTPYVSVSADFLYQMGARGGFQDKHQNDSSNNNPTGFSDLNGNSGSEKNATDGSFNTGTPKIMNYEGVRFLLSLNLHLDL